MSVLTLTQLAIAETRAVIYDRALAIARALGLAVDSWTTGDPTRSLYHVLAETISTSESTIAEYIKAGFLDSAEGEWLALLAEQVYGVAAVTATYATCTCRLTNNGGGIYACDPGNVTAKKGDVTYHNTTGGGLTSGPGTYLDLEFVADVAGSDGSAAVGEIDTLVTTYLLVSIENTTSAVGIDAESDDSIRSRCRAKLGSLSPNGAADAYRYVATSISGINRCKVEPVGVAGYVNIYLAGPSGEITDPTLLATVTDEIISKATPICVTPFVQSATGINLTVQYSIELYDSVGADVATIKTKIADILGDFVSSRPIGGDPGFKIFRSAIIAAIASAYPTQTYQVTLTSPAADLDMGNADVAILIHDPALSTVVIS